MSRNTLISHLMHPLSKVLVIGAVAALLVALWASNSAAYQMYSDAIGTTGQCAQCHTGFRETSPYISAAESFDWGTSLHAAHLDNTDIGSSCDNCHGGTGTFQRMVNLRSSAAAKDGVNAIACMGCHGRLEDANAFGPGPGWGAGLRQHHNEAGVPADSNGLLCVDCHLDADPANFTVADEDIMPAWYSSTTNDIVSLTLDPCNANLEEEFSGDPLDLGLDNDGDLAYDLDADAYVDPDVHADFDPDGHPDSDAHPRAGCGASVRIGRGRYGLATAAPQPQGQAEQTVIAR